MIKRYIAALFCLVVLGIVPVVAQQAHYPFNDPTLPMEKRIDNLLSLMTVDEKVDCLGTRTGVPRLGVPNIGSSEGIHGVVQRETRGKRLPITTTQFPQPPGMGEIVGSGAGSAGGWRGRLRSSIHHADSKI